MQAGFKPKLLTKKEWQDNRAPVCKGCGVGEALDQLQAYRNKTIATLSLEDLSKANTVVGKLMAALQKAEGKCGSAQKETKAGIGEYKKIVSDFEKRLKAAVMGHAAVAVKNLDEVFTKMNGDSAYREALTTFAKKGYFDEALDGWYLWKQKKYTDMVRKYGPKNDYNLAGETNTLLVEVFISRNNLTPEKLKKANEYLTANGGPGSCSQSFTEMLWNGSTQVKGFPKSEECKAYVKKKFPIVDFKM